MKAFLQRFAALVAGVLQGFDRLVFQGRLQRLDQPEAIHTLLGLNPVDRWDFEKYAAGLTTKLLAGSLVSQAKARQRFRYLNSPKGDKDETARAFAAPHQVQEGLVCVLQGVAPCWMFQKRKNVDGFWESDCANGRCSPLDHYYLPPLFGWMYVRLQTWLPFDMQVGINGREWWARQMDRAGLSYERSDNKVLWLEDGHRARRC